MVDLEMDHVLSLRRIAHEMFTGIHPINDPLSKVTMENPLEMEYWWNNPPKYLPSGYLT